MADTVSNTPNYDAEVTVLRNATEALADGQQKTEAQEKLTTLRQAIAAQKTEPEVRKEIDNLKKDLHIPNDRELNNNVVAVQNAQQNLENMKDPQEAVKSINAYVSKYVNQTDTSAP